MTDGRGDARAGRGAKTRPALGRVLAALLAFFWLDGMAQDLEPRRWSQLPTGLNVLGAGLARTDGDIFFDPVLRIDDATFDLYGLGVSYVRAFDWFGRSGRIDAVLPYATGRWEGLVDGEYTHLRRHGLADPRLRASINLYGAPAMSRAELARYAGENPVRTTIGAGLQVTLPFGEYMSRRLINLGGNRYVFQPQIGVLHQRNRWQFELTGSVFLFGDNDEFWQGTQLEQDPLWFVQGHVIYGFRPGWWVSLSGGYAYDGEASVNGVAKDNDARSGYWAASLGLPVGPRQSLKLAYVSAQTHVAAGVDTQGVAVAWSVNWGE